MFQVKIIKNVPQKVHVWGIFLTILQYLFPLLEQKALPPLEEKSESPPCWPFFYPPPAAHHRAQVFPRIIYGVAHV